MKWALGIMSGTSGDGVSLALCRFHQYSFKILREQTYPYPKSIATLLKNVTANSRVRPTLAEISRLNAILGIYFADCAVDFLKESRTSFSKIAVIGSHGHTVYHGPNDKPRNTLQLGEPSYLAERIGVPVISDFRPRDIAAGGQGAPLVPFFDDYFYGGGKIRALQNIGGIGNVTLVGMRVKTIAFDTGPGNCLIDLEMERYSKGRLKFDRNGMLGAKGEVNMTAIYEMLRHPYFYQKPPKSTGRELFNQAFIDRYLKKESFLNRIATLTFFTAASIFKSYEEFLPKPHEILVSGGGTKNKTLMRHLSDLFNQTPVKPMETLGIPSQAKEPAAFAFFAWTALQKRTNHAPQTTGAKHACVLGKLTF